MGSVDGGGLFQKIVERGSFTEADAIKVIRQVVRGIGYVHKMGMAHRDLKPDNLLCSMQGRDMVIKIADFGLSKQRTDCDPLKTACGTPDYAAPEVLTLDCAGYTEAVDMWSIGVITYVLLCGYPPFTSPTGNVPELFEAIQRAAYKFPDKDWASVSKDAKDFISKLLVVKESSRLTAEQALKHPWLASDAPLAASQSALNFSLFRQYVQQRMNDEH